MSFEVKHEKLRTIAVLSENNKGWTKELAVVSWNEGKPKYDIRNWGPEGELSKGITLNKEEALKLLEGLKDEL